MPLRLRPVGSVMNIPRFFAFPLIFTLVLSVGCGQKPGAVVSSSPPMAESDGEDSTFDVPDGNPEIIIAFVRELEKRQPKLTSEKEKSEYLANVQHALIAAGDKILAQPADDDILGEILQKKLVCTIRMAMTGGDDLAEKAVVEIAALRRDDRPVVAKLANEFWIIARSVNLAVLSKDERSELAEESIRRVIDSNYAKETFGEVAFVAEQLSKNGDSEMSASLFDRLAGTIAKSTTDSKLMSFASSLKRRAAQIRLLGSKMEIQGKMVGGDDFDWELYRGKVVLVDFWATWCGPCIGELPNVRANYDKYHELGFDVVAISLDNERKPLERFIRNEGVPWGQLFDDSSADAIGWRHPMAVRYGVNSIPAAFLVDRDGKIVSTEARGPELERLIKKLLDPPRKI